ncbi:MAG: flagellar basal body rod protein FlgB [Lachnospiraceae bacterium]
MISSGVFDYINVLNKAADASWLKETAITNNISNVNTPNYKRIDVDFESLLSKELGKGSIQSLDKKISAMNADLENLNASTYTDSASYSYRLDGNNVDIDSENVELASEQIRYQALTSSISGGFASLKAVIK